jgi:hypothetical protein
MGSLQVQRDKHLAHHGNKSPKGHDSVIIQNPTSSVSLHQRTNMKGANGDDLVEMQMEKLQSSENDGLDMQKNNPGEGHAQDCSMVLVDFCKNNKVDLVALQETRCSGNIARNTIKKLGFKYFLLEEARGFSGGIWVMWNRLDIKVDLIKTNFQFLHVQVKE